jgi:acyl transferase domain-containing protein
MGADLYQRYRIFRECMQEADQIVRELSGYSAVQMLYRDGYSKSETFDRTLLSHAAIFMVQHATTAVLIDAGVMPDLVVGTGIGTFAAAVAAGHLSMESALVAVVRQASMFEACCARGGMLAVLQENEPTIPALLLQERAEIAVHSLPGHCVIAALQSPLTQIEGELREKGTVVQRLPVPYAFHSRWIDEVREPFANFMRSVRFQRGQIPLMAPSGSELLTEMSDDCFWRAVREPIRFHDSIQWLETKGTHRYVDIGPSTTLSTIVSRTLVRGSASVACATLTPFGHDLNNIAVLVESNG